MQGKYPELAAQLANDGSPRTCPRAGTPTSAGFPADAKGMATRASSRARCSTSWPKHVPWLFGGSADLAPSTKTLLERSKASADFEAGNYGGRNLHFGIREHGMAAIAATAWRSASCGRTGPTFFVFIDYCKPSIRLAAIMGTCR